MSDSLRRILTVSELTLLVRDSLERAFSDIWLEGEISNLRSPGSGHLYFTLKDSVTQIRAVLFRAQAQRLRFALKEGLHVIVRGRVTVYEPRGEYQVVIEAAEPKGIGALQLAFEQLKEKLAAEGLFDPARKRPLPFLPRCVGVVTSPTGAAIRDILTILRRRCPLTHVLIHPVPVQGEAAADQIAHAIGSLNRTGRVDVIIVGRGGGSWEDLWAFNEEAVVRAIAASAVPIVSAVGHETDYTLADFAADLRAPTPSAAAEAVVPVLDELVETLGHLIARQRQAMRSRVHAVRHALVSRSGVLPCVQLRLQREAQRLDDMAARLTMHVRNLSAVSRQRLYRYCAGLDQCSPRVRLRGAWVLVSQLTKRAEQRMLGLVALRRQALRTLGAGLQGLSPLAVLARGYGIVQRVPDGRVIHAADEVAAGDEVTARLAKGRLLCQVRKVLPDAG
jgi:exodeoxyribonuclease VII large subunit